FFFFFSSRRRHTRFSRDWSSDVCSSDLKAGKRVGRWKFYHDPTRALVEEGEYVDGLRQGMWTEYFTNGHRFREVEYKDDQRVGRSEERRVEKEVGSECMW